MKALNDGLEVTRAMRDTRPLKEVRKKRTGKFRVVPYGEGYGVLGLARPVGSTSRAGGIYILFSTEAEAQDALRKYRTALPVDERGVGGHADALFVSELWKKRYVPYVPGEDG